MTEESIKFENCSQPEFKTLLVVTHCGHIYETKIKHNISPNILSKRLLPVSGAAGKQIKVFCVQRPLVFKTRHTAVFIIYDCSFKRLSISYKPYFYIIINIFVYLFFLQKAFEHVAKFKDLPIYI